MKVALKVLTVNLLLTLMLITLIEGFFFLDFKFHFLPPLSRLSYLLNSNKFSPWDQTVWKHNEIFNIPVEYRIDYSRLNDVQRAELKIEKPSGDSKSKNEHANATYKVQIVESGNPTNSFFDLTYRFDSYGRRLVENQSTKKQDSAIIALGDSCTFGAALNQGHDYPSLLAKTLQGRSKVYNFGMNGSSINDHYVKMKSDPHYFDGIQEKDGTIVWLFFKHQLDRFFCEYNCYQPQMQYMREKHELKIEDGKIVDLGPFKERSAMKIKIYQLLQHSYLLKYFNFDWPFRYSRDQLKDFVGVFKEVVNEFKKRHNIKRVIVYNMISVPGQRDLKELFDSEGIEFFNLAQTRYVKHIQTLRIPNEGHLTPEFNYFFAELVKLHLNSGELIKAEPLTK